MTVVSGHRWRRLTLDQAAEVRRARLSGVSVGALAARYGVTRRTIYRSLQRAVTETHEVRIPGWRTRVAIEADGPVLVEPWRPTWADE